MTLFLKLTLSKRCKAGKDSTMSNTTTYEIIWNNITISIIYIRKWCGAEIDHIEVRSISPEKAPLPITETGYKSHFHHETALDEYNDAKAYVTAWLDHEAKSQKWKAYVESQQQLLLF